MTKIARLIWVEEYAWNQAEMIYPRQLSRMINDYLLSIVNIKIDITDEEGEQLKIEREEIKEKSEHILSCLKEHDLKIKAWEAKKREETIKKNKELEESYKEAGIQGKAIRASGFLESISGVQ